MKWNYFFGCLVIYLSSGIASAAVIDINDPDTLVVNNAISWNILTDTTYNYNNILITKSGVLNISGTASIPDITLNSVGNIEIYGALNIRDVDLTLNAGNRFYFSGDFTTNANFKIRGAGVNPDSASSGILITGKDPGLLNTPYIKLVPLTGGLVPLTSGHITVVPLPASLWLMLPGLIAFSRFRFS